MIKDKIVFELSDRRHGFQSHFLSQMLLDEADKKVKSRKSANTELFLRVGKYYNPVPFNFTLLAKHTGEEITGINMRDFINNAFEKLEPYRKIGNDTYILKKDRWVKGENILDGHNVIAFDGEPCYTIAQERDTNWTKTSMVFRPYKGDDFFSYKSDFDAMNVELEVSVELLKKDGVEFRNMWNATTKYYKDLGSKVIEE